METFDELYVATLDSVSSLAVCCLPGLDVDDLHYLCEQVLERTPATACASLSPVGGDASRFAYVMASTDKDLRDLCKELNARLCGRGGGKPHMVQGSWAASFTDAKAAIQELMG